MIRDQQAHPIAIVSFALGIVLGVAMFFSIISVVPAIRSAFFTTPETTAANSQLPVMELYRQAGREAAVDAIRM